MRFLVERVERVGWTVVAAAEAARVSRSLVYRWLRRWEAERMHLGQSSIDTGRAQQQTETTARQREILTLLEIAEPKVVLDITPGRRRLSRST